MKLIQFHLPNLGKRVGIVTRDEEVIDVTSEGIIRCIRDTGTCRSGAGEHRCNPC